jgi:hypothetical protein
MRDVRILPGNAVRAARAKPAFKHRKEHAAGAAPCGTPAANRPDPEHKCARAAAQVY